MDELSIRCGKFMSLVLRHQPETYGLTLDKQGWAQIDDLIKSENRVGVPLSREVLDHIVNKNDKQRYSVNEDGSAIRARQGHSIKVDLELQPQKPPEKLYHGTAEKSVASIQKLGLQRRSRNHVHLSSDITTATNVGKRHGKPVVLVVDSGAMARDGYNFYCSENGVWLVDVVPAQYLLFS